LPRVDLLDPALEEGNMPETHIAWNAGGAGNCGRCGVASGNRALITSSEGMGVIRLCDDCAEAFKRGDPKVFNEVLHQLER
jgi:hypothetical protein